MWERFCCYAYADKKINLTGSSRMRALQVRFNKSELMRCLETTTTCSFDSFISARAPLKCITHTLFTVLLHPANSLQMIYCIIKRHLRVFTPLWFTTEN